MKTVIQACLLASLASAAFANVGESVTFNGFTYEHYLSGTDYTNFCGAIQKCHSRGGILAVSNSQIVNDEILDLVRYDRVWLGADDAMCENSWLWMDGSPMTWSNWIAGEPNDYWSEDCLVLNGETTNGGWYDDSCGDNQNYVCQYPTTRTRVFANIEFTYYEDEMNYTTAKKECMKSGARLVQVENDEEEEALQQKLPIAGSAGFWIGTTASNGDCLVLGDAGLQKHGCGSTGFGAVCETARPNSVRVSDEQPKVKQSKDLKIECTASGYPVPDVAWYKDQNLVTNQSIGDARSILHIENACSTDAGRYVCIASNEIDGERKVAKGVSYVTVEKK